MSTMPGREARDPTARDHFAGLSLDPHGEENYDRRLNDREMAAEEAALGLAAPSPSPPPPPISADARYLHVSRTIHQLVTDRNRSVGIFLFVASLLFGSSTALLNAPAAVEPIVPLKAIQFWCLPVTFFTLATIAVFTGLILIRTRIGLLHEAAKMNALLGLPAATSVRRVNLLSVFYLMYLLVVLLGGASAGFATAMVAGGGLRAAGWAVVLVAVAALYIGGFLGLYYWMVLRATSDDKLSRSRA